MELFELAKILVPIIFGTITFLGFVSFIAYKLNKSGDKKYNSNTSSSPKDEVKIIFHHTTCTAGGCDRHECIGNYCKNNLANKQSPKRNNSNHFNMVAEPSRSWR